jgi:hypothetical protein
VLRRQPEKQMLHLPRAELVARGLPSAIYDPLETAPIPKNYFAAPIISGRYAKCIVS